MTQLVLNIENPSALKAIKALVKNMVGVHIAPKTRQRRKTNLELSLEEAERGEIVGPFNSVDDLMKDLLS